MLSVLDSGGDRLIPESKSAVKFKNNVVISHLTPVQLCFLNVYSQKSINWDGEKTLGAGGNTILFYALCFSSLNCNMFQKKMKSCFRGVITAPIK